MGRRVSRVICVVLLIALTLSVLWFADRVLLVKRNDGVTDMQDFYAQKDNTIDVLLLGSSQMGMNVDTEVFWTRYGIASYALWASEQPFWNTYHFLVEALKTQSPAVVVLDVYAASFLSEYSDLARQVTNTAGMRFSRNKIEAVKATAPRENWIDLLLGLPYYHERFYEITGNDFRHFSWNPELINDKGSDCRYGVRGYEPEDVSGIREVADLLPKEEAYLRKIIELCEAAEQPLILVKTPSIARKTLQPYCNAVEKIAAEYGVDFYNFNLMDRETGIAAGDFWNDGHLNTNGARKVSDYIARLVREEYAVADHRGDVEYDSWNVNAANLQNGYIRKITEAGDYFRELARNSREVLIVNNAERTASGAYAGLEALMAAAGLDVEAAFSGGRGGWLLTDTRGGQLVDARGGEAYAISRGGLSVSVEFGDDGFEVSMDGAPVCRQSLPGLYFIVFDRDAQICTDIAAFSPEDELQPVHLDAIRH